MSFRKWRVGLWVACATGFFTGVAALGVGTPWKGALLLLAVSIGKDFLLYQKDHPVDQITFDAGSITKTETQPIKPAGQGDLTR